MKAATRHVYSHAAIKKTTPNWVIYTGKGLIDSTVLKKGWEASEIYNHGKKGSKHVLLHMVAGRRGAEQKREKPFMKPFVVRTHSLSEDNMGAAPSNHLLPGPSRWGLQFEMGITGQTIQMQTVTQWPGSPVLGPW